MTQPCKICGHTVQNLFHEVVLLRHQAEYKHCPDCGLIQVDQPHWLEEAYSDAITAHDIGLLNRNIRNSKILTPYLFNTFGTRGVYLDTAGGYGLFTRLMRDIGFNFEHTDKFCENIFARSFECSQTKYSAITAFELLEHVTDPGQFMQDEILPYSPENIIFSTETYTGAPPPKTWWYYTFDTGQHISFYTKKSLEILAKKNGYHYHPLPKDLHLFTKQNVSLGQVQKQLKFGPLNLKKRQTLKTLKRLNLKKQDAELVKQQFRNG
jgi:hypothetical protein